MVEWGGKGEAGWFVHGSRLARNSRASSWRSPPPRGVGNWDVNVSLWWGRFHAVGSNRDDKSYVAGTAENEGRSAMDKGGGGASSDGGWGGGVGSSRVARWACK